MAPRAYWKGWLKLEAISCPVRLYAATSAANRIAFHEINRETGHRINLRAHEPESGREVGKDEIVKGWQVEKDRYLVVGEDEIDALRVTPTKIIDVEAFVPRAELDHAYFDKPYYLAPDGAIADQTYRVVREAMVRSDHAAIGRVVLSRADHAVALMPKDAGIVMMTLRPPLDMRAQKEIEGEIGKGKLDPEMVELASLIMERRAGHFDPAKFEDQYQTALRRLVEAKLKGEKIELPKKKRPPAQVIDLKEVLRRSVRAEGGAPEPRKRGRKGSGERSGPEARR
jgi:DNA end-binding protein Ku